MGDGKFSEMVQQIQLLGLVVLLSAVVCVHASQTQTSTNEQPCMVLAGGRHGSRYPLGTHDWDFQLGWPSSKSKFWKHNGGKLTAQGVTGMEQVGRKFADRYPNLFGSTRAHKENMKIFTDVAHRTIESATAMLKGALGASPTTKVSDMDRDASAGEEYFDQTDGYRLWEATENTGCTGDQCDYAVELHLAESLISMPNNMSVLEGAHYKTWTEDQAEMFCGLSENVFGQARFIDLMEGATGFTNPGCEEKIDFVHNLGTQMHVNRAVGLSCFPNTNNEAALTSAELEELRIAHDSLVPLFSSGVNGNVSTSAARFAGTIGAVVGYSMNRVQGQLQESEGVCQDPKFVYFSGHDHNLNQLFAMVGIEAANWPTFGSYWLIEVFSSHINFCYNWDAENHPFEDPVCVALDPGTGDDFTERAEMMTGIGELSTGLPSNSEYVKRSLKRFVHDNQLTDEEMDAVTRARELIFTERDTTAALA